MEPGRLTVIDGMDVGQTFLLDKDDILVGHHLLECDIYLEDASVARAHARLYRDDGSWFVKDTSKGQGILVNDAPVEDEAALKHGDRIQLGESVLRIDLGSGERETHASRLVWIALAGLLGLAVFIFVFQPARSGGGASVNGVEQVQVVAKVHIPWKGNQYPLDVPPDEKAAQEAWERGLKYYRERTVHLGNAYNAVIEFKRVLMLTEAIPDERKPACRDEVKRIDKETKINRIEELQRYIAENEGKLERAINWAEHVSWWKRMEEYLKQYQALFPDKDTEEHKWAEEKLRQLRKKGLVG